MEKPDVHLLMGINWQLFGSLTFKQERLPERVRLSMFFAFARTLCKWHRVYFPELVWCLRQEFGEIGGRRHFHCLIAGLPRHVVHVPTCMALKALWEQVGGGMARISEFDPTLNGEGYLLKCLGVPSDLGDLYESTKFGGDCELMLSKSVNRINQAAIRRSGLHPAGRCRGQEHV